MKLRELATLVGGSLVGDGETEVTRVAEPHHAGPGALVLAAGRRQLDAAEAGVASAVLIPDELAAATHVPAIVAANVRLAFARSIAALHPSFPASPGIHDTAVLGSGVTLGTDVAIGPHVVIGDHTTVGDGAVISALCAIGRDVTIGAHSMLHPLVTIYDRCVLGRRVILHAGAVIGADGFGYVHDGQAHIKIPQIGRVVLEDDVEIGANTAVDRATLGETRIGAGTKIDNLVQVAHNVVIGRHVIVAAQTGIAGSAAVADDAVLAGQAGVVDHVSIGAGAVLMARAAAQADVPPGAVVSGSPAFNHRDELKVTAIARRLPEIVERLRALEEAVGVSPHRRKKNAKTAP